MSLLETITILKEAILGDDMTLVCDAYKMLTGEELHDSVGKADEEDVIEDIIDELSESSKSKWIYDCEYCGAEMLEFDKQRKRCPECNKQKLILIWSPIEDNIFGEENKTVILFPTEDELLEISDEFIDNYGIEGSLKYLKDEEPEETPEKDDPFAQFRVKQNTDRRSTNEDGKVSARRIPFDKNNKPKANNIGEVPWEDDGVSFAEDKETDKLLSTNKSVRAGLAEKRTQDTSKKIKVQCFICSKWEEVSPTLSRGWDKNPNDNTYRCNDCCALRKR